MAATKKVGGSSKARFPGTLPSIFATAIVEAAAQRGAPRKELLGDVGLVSKALSNPEAPLPVETIFALWESAMHRLRSDGLPIAVAQTFTLEDYPVLGFVVMTAATTRDALARVVRFHSIVSPAARWTVEESGEVVRLRWHREGPRTLGHRVANESALAEFVHATRQAVGARVTPIATSFRHAAPADHCAHRAHFGSEIRWEAKVDELVFLRSMLDAVPRMANPALSAHFDRQAERLMAKVNESDEVSLRVRHAVEDSLPSGEPVSSLVAKQLAMSERTLRRTLAMEGTSFREIVESVRKDRATLLLEDRRSSLAEIAVSLGFSELSAFSRAFKRWTGRSPSDARQRVQKL